MSQEKDLLFDEHPDVQYLLNDAVSMVLSQALADTYDQQPNDPVEYFSKYLLNHIQVREQADKDREDAVKVQSCRDAHEVQLQKQAAEEQKKVEAEAKVIARKKAFFDKIEASSDLNENLQDLCDYVMDLTNATGVYIGKLEFQKKPIAEDAGENDDLDEAAAKVIQFTHASKTHKNMVNTVLTPDEAPISHSVFNFGDVTQQPPAEEQPPAEAEGQVEAKEEEEPSEDIIDTFQHVYVPEVVRE